MGHPAAQLLQWRTILVTFVLQGTKVRHAPGAAGTSVARMALASAAAGGLTGLDAPAEAARPDAPKGGAQRAVAVLLREPDLDRWGPPLALLVLGLGVIAARGALPVDETRYIEVAREFHFSHPLNLHLNGGPYAHKPPLAFWIAEALQVLGLPIDLALRIVPVAASAATAYLVSHMGRRLGLRHAGWVFATLLLPLIHTQVLLIDPLFSLSIWACIDALSRGRNASAACAAALAFLAKGPMAAVFLAPMGLAVAGMRAPREQRLLHGMTALGLLLSGLHLRRVTLGLGELLRSDAGMPTAMAWTLWGCTFLAWWVSFGCSPRHHRLASLPLPILFGVMVMTSWALESSVRGGAMYASDLLVRQTGGRLTHTFAHSRPALFYLPVMLLGALPAVPSAWFARPTGTIRRLTLAGAVSFGLLALVAQKQPHYLLPLCPVAALLLTQAIEKSPRALALWRSGAVWTLSTAILAWLAVAVALVGGWVASRFGARADELTRSGAWWVAWSVGAGLAVTALAGIHRHAGAFPRLAMLYLAGMIAMALPAHWAIDQLSTPRAIREATIGQSTDPLAVYRCFHGGYFNWLTGREQVTRLEDPEQLRDWGARHPRGMVICPIEQADALSMQGAVDDLYRGRPYTLRRVSASP